jgi:hypothetical protein
MKLDRNVVFTIVVGIMMITWAMGMALSYNIKTSTNTGMRIENVYTEPLTGQEKVTILRSGRMLIEYMYVPSEESLEKIPVYDGFVNRFKDFVVLERVEVPDANQTLDQMIAPTGDVIPLGNVTEAQLVDVFCDNTYVQPKECLLRSI